MLRTVLSGSIDVLYKISSLAGLVFDGLARFIKYASFFAVIVFPLSIFFTNPD